MFMRTFKSAEFPINDRHGDSGGGPVRGSLEPKMPALPRSVRNPRTQQDSRVLYHLDGFDPPDLLPLSLQWWYKMQRARKLFGRTRVGMPSLPPPLGCSHEMINRAAGENEMKGAELGSRNEKLKKKQARKRGGAIMQDGI